MDLSAFRNLFGDLQEYVVGILNQDELIDAMGAKFASENALDIEYEVKDALAKTGMACVVMTPTATYQGHNGIQQTFTCDELTLQIVENPVVHRPWLKKNNLAHGTGLDVAKAASDRLAGPQGGHFGQFTTKRIQEAEQSGLLVVTATFGCTVYETLSAVPSGDISGHWTEVPFVRMSELSDWIDDYLSSHMPQVDVSGYLPLSGGEMSGSIDMGGNDISIGGYQITDASAAGLNIYDSTMDQAYQFGGAESDWSVVRQKDLASGYVKTENSTPLTVTVPYDYGFTLQTPNGTPLIQTIDLNRTSINGLSAGSVEVGQGGVTTFPGAGVDTTKLSAWQWLKTGETGLGGVISSEHNAILGEVSEDFVSFNWLIQQGYVTSADISSLTGAYLPLSGGQMEGGISWDYGGSGGPRIDGPWSPQQLAFSTTFADDQGKQAFLDFGRISADGQYTIAFVEDIQAALGDISALIHES